MQGLTEGSMSFKRLEEIQYEKQWILGLRGELAELESAMPCLRDGQIGQVYLKQ